MPTKLIQIGKRLLQSLPSLFGVVVISFVLTRALPGDPAAYFAGAMADAASIAQVRESLGLDRSWPEQFVLYVGRLLQGDLGMSLGTGVPVMEELLTRLPASLELTFCGLGLAIAVAIPLGVLAATRPGSWIDHLCRVVVTAGVSLPTFFTGLFLIYIFYFLLGWAPSPLGRLDILYLSPERVTGFFLIDSIIAGDAETFWASLRQLVLPAITLGVFAMAPIARMTRAAMLNALSSEYVRSARANGLSRSTILGAYALRNAALPVLTTLGMVFSFLLGANVLVEKVFSWPGIGSYAIQALVASDYAAVQGFVLAMALLFVFVNLLIDVVLTLVDPRVGLDA
ncbi:MAG: peptide ABC transporter permease [Betaproteobacteria bacterium HGW-Betaproteobacteria-13]|jgi:peptide/nickel transport system permease protein|uniref:Peptide ABC transporter permease n=1 Tax=Parazoarcus communis TaxID=41977 RepID=A0A2U8GPH9_9RHOO|nr:ABC transporter permease [Parazoarcus communis]AWI75390.1 peptide ABC transporter permease [Parazoarcus communis]AWI81805.1 peptide ABC transporter permease [Parazoarcus communis]PKO80595.1 MAG: peptide ABC transporter permease [Betaproteobacteria bacterium HGW-Betaproteobacteria-13]